MHTPSDNEPSRLQTLLLLLSSRDSAAQVANGPPVSLRLPAATFAMVDALSQHSGQSRNKIVCELIEVALAEIAREIGDADRHALVALQEEILRTLSLKD